MRKGEEAMITPLVRIIFMEFSALAGLALTVGISGGFLLQAFSRPEAVILFSATASILFGALGGGFRRQERKLEFLLTRNIKRAGYYALRFLVGLTLLLPIVIITATNLLLPVSGWFWSMFVESGLTFSEKLAFPDGLGWSLLGLSTSVWGYTASFFLISLACDASQIIIALFIAIVVFVALPILCIGFSEILALLGFLSTVQIYSPLSFVWITYQILVLVAAGLVLISGVRRFEKADIA